MALYTVRTTRAQDRAIGFFLRLYNVEHPDAPITAEEYIQQQADITLGNAELRFKAQALDLIPKRLPAASDSTLDQILTLLGLDAPQEPTP